MFFLLSIAGGIFLALGFYVVDVVSPIKQAANLSEDNDISAKAWVVFNPETGEVLLSKNQDESLPIASITKLFLAEEVLKEEGLFSTTTITWSDLSNYGTAGRLSYGEVYDFYTLLFPLLLSSSNDAASVIERNFPDIVERMNNRSADLGTSAHFSDSSGLSPANAATAKDVAALAAQVYSNSPQAMAITRLPYHAREKIGWQNNNPVFGQAGFNGGKSGYTDEAGHTLVVFFNEETILGESKPLGYVLLGSDDLVGDTEKLRKYTSTRLWWYALAAKWYNHR